MEHRIEQLELKLAEQEQTNAGLRADIKSLKDIQNGDRNEYLAQLEHFDAKIKKLFALLREANASTAAQEDQPQHLDTDEELQLFSGQLDDPRTLADRNAAGMHAADPPNTVDSPTDPTADLIVFTPARPLINVDENVESSVEARSGTPALQSHANNTTSPPLGVSSREAASVARFNSEDVSSVKSSAAEREPSPIVRISPPAASAQPVNEEQIAQMTKRVRFDLSALRAKPTAVDSPDPLAPDATLRKNLLSKKRNIAAANNESPVPAAKSSKPARRKPAATPKSSSGKPAAPSKSSSRKPAATPKSSSGKPAATPKPSSGKPAGILDRFKDGRLNSDSDDEEEKSEQMQTQTSVSDSQDTEPTIDLAERAVASLIEASMDEGAAGTRRSGRARKAKDFGDVEVHGWKPKRARRS